MNDTKHTPEPWWDESGVAHAKGPSWTEENHSCVHPIANQNGTLNDCERAVACVNACAGINPEAVPDMLAALEDFNILECPTCSGWGHLEATPKDACHGCGGAGEIVTGGWPDHVRSALKKADIDS